MCDSCGECNVCCASRIKSILEKISERLLPNHVIIFAMSFIQHLSLEGMWCWVLVFCFEVIAGCLILAGRCCSIMCFCHALVVLQGRGMTGQE